MKVTEVGRSEKWTGNSGKRMSRKECLMTEEIYQDWNLTEMQTTGTLHLKKKNEKEQSKSSLSIFFLFLKLGSLFKIFNCLERKPLFVGCLGAWPYFPHTKTPWSRTTISRSLSEPKRHLLFYLLFLSEMPTGRPGWGGCWHHATSLSISRLKGSRVLRQDYGDSPTLAVVFQLPRCVTIKKHNIPYPIPGPQGQNCSLCQWTACSCTSRAESEQAWVRDLNMA